MKLAIRITVSAIVLILAFSLGCAKKAPQTPQYNAGTVVDDFSIALKAAQDVEIGFHTAGVVPDQTHFAIQRIFLQSAEVGKQATAAVRAGDFTSAKQYFQSAIGLLQGLQPEMVGIKNPDTERTFAIAVQAAISIAQQWVNALASPTPTTSILIGRQVYA